MDRTYILYDSRACAGDGTEDASVIEVCESEAEAKRYDGHSGAVACYSYAKEGKTLTDERFEWNWFPRKSWTPHRKTRVRRRQ